MMLVVLVAARVAAVARRRGRKGGNYPSAGSGGQAG